MRQNKSFSRKIHSVVLRAAGGREALRRNPEVWQIVQPPFYRVDSTVSTTFRRRRINHPRAGAAFTRKGRHDEAEGWIRAGGDGTAK